MNPARVMGVFLRTWRAEWAHLSRAQLAIALSSRCSRRRAITPAIIRQWEAGQPPQSSEELLALLATMGRHGLDGDALTQFQEAVLAAAAGHLYPELMDGDAVAYSPDVDSVAEQLFETSRVRSTTTSLPTVVAFVDELEGVVIREEGPRPSPTQRHRQEVALAYAQAAQGLGYPEGKECRDRWVAEQLDANAAYLGAYFGPGGLGGRLTPLGQRVMAAFWRAHSTHSASWARRLLALSEQAGGRGERNLVGEAYLRGVHCLAEAELGAVGPFLDRAQTCLDQAILLARPDDDHSPYLDLLWACLVEGDERTAERCLAEFGQWASFEHRVHPQWCQASVWLALSRGDSATVQHYVGTDYDMAEAASTGQPLSYGESVRRRLMAGV